MTQRFNKDTASRVRLNSDPSIVGWMVEQGPEQSIVLWPNGNKDCVVNKWISVVNGPITFKSKLDAPKMAAPTGTVTGRVPSVDPAISNMPKAPEPKPKKPRKEPDALALKVAEFDDKQLKKFATANGCWQDKYLELPNNGLRRMNVMNRLRAKIKNDPKYAVVWP